LVNTDLSWKTFLDKSWTLTILFRIPFFFIKYGIKINILIFIYNSNLISRYMKSYTFIERPWPPCSTDCRLATLCPWPSHDRWLTADVSSRFLAVAAWLSCFLSSWPSTPFSLIGSPQTDLSFRIRNILLDWWAITSPCLVRRVSNLRSIVN